MKLPTPRKRGDTITVSHEGKRFYCTRDTPKECLQWAALKLLELKTQSRVDAGKEKPKFLFGLITFNDAVDIEGMFIENGGFI